MISQSDVRVKYTNDRVRRSSRHDARPETDHAVRWHEMISQYAFFSRNMFIVHVAGIFFLLVTQIFLSKKKYRYLLSNINSIELTSHFFLRHITSSRLMDENDTLQFCNAYLAHMPKRLIKYFILFNRMSYHQIHQYVFCI